MLLLFSWTQSQVKHYNPIKKADSIALDLAKKNFWAFKEISNLSFKYMEFVLTRNHFCNWCWSSNYWDFFNKTKSSCLNKSFWNRFSAVSFLKTLGYLYEVFEIQEKSTSAKKVALRDAKEDVHKICIEVQKLLTTQIESLHWFLSSTQRIMAKYSNLV